MARKGEQNGVENDPNVKQQLKLSRDQVLASAYNQKLLDDAQPSDAEIQKYYDQNPSSFEEVTLQRLYIPKATPTKDKPVDANAEKSAAQKLRDRAASGEDFNKLEKEAFANQPNPQSAPPADMGPRRRGSLPPDQESAVFALKPGEVSQLMENPAGWYVYKVTAKRTVPFADVKEEVSRKLQQQKYMDMRNDITNSADIKLNEAYFGAPEGEMPGMPGMHPPPSGPSSKKPPASPTPQTQPHR
jgi:parvulin-like peptidyl-prolyl isomerase